MARSPSCQKVLVLLCSGLEVKVALADFAQLRPFLGYLRSEVFNTDEPGLYKIFHGELWMAVFPDHQRMATSRIRHLQPIKVL